MCSLAIWHILGPSGNSDGPNWRSNGPKITQKCSLAIWHTLQPSGTSDGRNWRSEDESQSSDTARVRWLSVQHETAAHNRLVHACDRAKRLEFELRSVDQRMWRVADFKVPMGVKTL